jgi:hypothetical protein
VDPNDYDYPDGPSDAELAAMTEDEVIQLYMQGFIEEDKMFEFADRN